MNLKIEQLAIYYNRTRDLYNKVVLKVKNPTIHYTYTNLCPRM